MSLPERKDLKVLYNEELDKERRVRDYSKYYALINSGWKLKSDNLFLAL